MDDVQEKKKRAAEEVRSEDAVTRKKKKRKQNKANRTFHKKAEEKDKAEEEAERTAKAEAEKESRKPKLSADDIAKALKTEFGTLSDWLNPSHTKFWPELKESWKLLSKKERTKLVEANSEKCKSQVQSVDHPFPTVSDDHCETSADAYRDIAPILDWLCEKLGKKKSQLKIYDPYYCAGGTMKHLLEVGYMNVYNKNEDFYKVEQIPDHDVLVTNPPYSSDHVERLLDFVEKNGKPALLLMPNYISQKPYFDSTKYSFVTPTKRYMYWTPKGLRPKEKSQSHVSSSGIRTSPFPSFWYVRMNEASPKPIDMSRIFRVSRLCKFVPSVDGLGQLATSN